MIHRDFVNILAVLQVHHVSDPLFDRQRTSQSLLLRRDRQLPMWCLTRKLLPMIIGSLRVMRLGDDALPRATHRDESGGRIGAMRAPRTSPC